MLIAYKALSPQITQNQLRDELDEFLETPEMRKLLSQSSLVGLFRAQHLDPVIMTACGGTAFSISDFYFQLRTLILEKFNKENARPLDRVLVPFTWGKVTEGYSACVSLVGIEQIEAENAILHHRGFAIDIQCDSAELTYITLVRLVDVFGSHYGNKAAAAEARLLYDRNSTERCRRIRLGSNTAPLALPVTYIDDINTVFNEFQDKAGLTGRLIMNLKSVTRRHISEVVDKSTNSLDKMYWLDPNMSRG